MCIILSIIYCTYFTFFDTFPFCQAQLISLP
nr:MAG TPA: protein of unknown function (DUF5412) [Bacteriophage sp.]